MLHAELLFDTVAPFMARLSKTGRFEGLTDIARTCHDFRK
jgi:hypothetical protein